jgi:choline dehydrogenase-like flavoprotein
MHRKNLTVLTNATVLRLTFDGQRATGVDVIYEGKSRHFNAHAEVILSLGAINSPKVIMQSGVSDKADLQKLGIPVVQHLPGVGQNFQDHVGFDCVWEYAEALPPRNTMAEATFFWKSEHSLHGPDIQTCQEQLLHFGSRGRNASRRTVADDAAELCRILSGIECGAGGPGSGDPLRLGMGSHLQLRARSAGG